MPIMEKRRKGDFEAEAELARLQALTRLQALAREQSERFGPYADLAKTTAAQRLHQARGWTAPRLEMAAQRVEDTVAPRVADFLTSAAHKVEPHKGRRGMFAARKNRMRAPRTMVFVGVAALGAAAIYGALKLRQASQDAEWQENIDQAREQVRETRGQLAAKARDAKDRIRGNSEDMKVDTEQKETAAAGAKQSTQDLNGRIA